ncbi:MAG: hypothetical protein ACLFPJ_03955 [Candidatus Woesearchaeota archaeon]
MEISRIIKKLTNSNKFIDWHKNNSNYYLAHVFLMDNQDIQIGYYNPDTDKIISFIIKINLNDVDKYTNFIENEDVDDFIQIIDAQEAFKESGKISELNLNNIKTNLDEVLNFTNSFFEKNYSEVITKKMIILQVIEEDTIYNFTYITKSLNFVNIKVNALNLDVISHKKESILNLKKS